VQPELEALRTQAQQLAKLLIEQQTALAETTKTMIAALQEIRADVVRLKRIIREKLGDSSTN
jgi:hypothetical protein